ncbi:RNA-binding protein 7 isoform X2 [Heliangelus exortis]|uniref:RNA-binding protein 7 isoform X2 n=1 Tax=Heliangelus exortis TaxID=472823 RepID=UPI003A9359C1
MGAAAAEADRTLFVGNLDPKVTEELIFELFHQAGPVIKVKIPRDRDGRPKQFAFVNFKHEESVPYGLSLLNGIKLYGRPIKIQFRSGSSHASQDGNLSCSPQGASLSHPPPSCSRYERSPDSTGAAAGFSSSPRALPSSEHLQRQVMNSTLRPQFGGKYEPTTFAPPGYQPPPHAFHPPPRRPEVPALRKGRVGAHPYHHPAPDRRHVGREPRFDYGRGKREEYGGFEERGHDPEHHYRGGELPYEDRHRESWNHDYDHRRESYREAKWHPARH